MITQHITGSAAALAAIAAPEPKNIWIHGSQTFISTGSDMAVVPAPTQDEIDAVAAKAYAKLAALRTMTPAQVDAWVSANVTNVATAIDAIKTLAIGMSVLARRL